MTGHLMEENRKLDVAFAGEYSNYSEEQKRDLAAEEEWVGKDRNESMERRPVMLYAPLCTGLAVNLNFVFAASGVRESRSTCEDDSS